MPEGVEVKVTKNGMLAAGKAPSVSTEMGVAGRNALIQHYANVGGSFAQWGREVSFQSTEGTATLSIDNKILRHKISGGPIKAKKSRYLTIPLAPNANSFKSLVFIKSKAGNLLLADVSGDELVPVFVLKPEVQQSPDPRAQPNVGAVERAATQAADAKVAQAEKV